MRSRNRAAVGAVLDLRMSSASEWNRKVIEEFRERGGKVGGNFEGASMLLLTTTGRRTGKSYTNPLVYLPDGDRMIVFASNNGADRDPDWYRNLVAAESATVEVGTDSFQVRPSEIEGDEYESLYRRQVARRPRFGEYRRMTSRKIPVVALDRIS